MSTVFLTVISRSRARVWFVLAAQVLRGLAQMHTRIVTWRSVIILPVVLCVLSPSGVASAFGLNAAVEGPWLLGGLPGPELTHVFAPPGGVQALPDRRLLHGASALPLATMMAVLFMRFVANDSLVVALVLAQPSLFAAGAALLYGLPIGPMAGRALHIRGSDGAARPALA